MLTFGRCCVVIRDNSPMPHVLNHCQLGKRFQLFRIIGDLIPIWPGLSLDLLQASNQDRLLFLDLGGEIRCQGLFGR